MGDTLAIDGGAPVRTPMLPYARQTIDDDDIAAVVEVLRCDWLTTGPKVAEFEQAFASFVGVEHAVAVGSGTAALHAGMHVLGIGPGDEVIVPAMTFASSANAVVFCGGTPVFADVDVGTLLIDPRDVERRITPRTRAIVAVDFAGQPCDYETLRPIASAAGCSILADACHALGAAVQASGGGPVAAGSLGDVSAFSFHPVKHITTGEGGMMTTHDADQATRARAFRNHCMTRDHRQRSARDSWEYDITDLGYNYRLSDMQCALGISQLRKLPAWLVRRREIARRYAAAFAEVAGVTALRVRGGVDHAYHLYVVMLEQERLRADRAMVFKALRAEGIGVNVHYQPVHLMTMYRRRFGTGPGDCPVAERAYERMLSLPLFPSMTDEDVGDVIAAVDKVLAHYRDGA